MATRTSRSRKQGDTAGPLRAGISVRVSMDKSAHGMADEIVSPETQEDRARQYCGSQGWTVVAVEHDIDESGFRQHYSKRKGLMRLLQMVERGELDRIVVWKYSRLSRRLREFIEICDLVESHGAGVASVSEQNDTGTSSGRLVRNILASFAQFQSEDLSEQISETWRTRVQQGRRPAGGVPYGTVSEKGLLSPHPEQHQHLLAMYSTFRDEQTLSAVWQYLHDRKIPAPHADVWSINTIRKILTNPTYVSQLEWAGEIHQARWAPIVPVDLWEEVQGIMGGRRTGGFERQDRRLLTGMLRCGLCGKPMWTRYHRDGQGRIYRCTNQRNGRRGCDVPLVHGPEVEVAVWNVIEMLSRLDNLDDQVAIARRDRDRRNQDGPARVRQRLIAERDSIQQMVDQLFDMLQTSDITREQFRTQNRRYTEQLEELERKLSDVPAGAAEREPAAVLAAIRQAGEVTTEADRRRTLSEADVRIEVRPERVDLMVLDIRINLRARLVGDTWHFGDEYQRLDYRGKLYTDKQIRFLQRTYLWANKTKLAARMGRSYATLRMAAKHLRQRGLLPASDRGQERK